MSNWEKIGGLQVAKSLRNLVEQEVLPGLEIKASEIWDKLESILKEFMPRNKALLQKRQDIQKKINQSLRYPSTQLRLQEGNKSLF